MTARAWLDSLPPAERDALAARYARDLEAAGLTVYRAAEDKHVPIPPVLSPEVVDDALMAGLSRDAHHLLSATVKLVRRLLTDGGPIAHRLVHGFTPLELAALTPGRERLGDCAVARVDYFLDTDGAPRALELNATIPAMQGYADLIAHGWARVVGQARGLPGQVIDTAIEAIGENTRDLLASVLAHYRLRGGKARTPSILIVSRRGDAQIGELRHYERRWTELGHPAMHCWADELEAAPDSRVRARGRDFDLVYRHIFARRVEPSSPLGRLLVDPGQGTIIINPVMSPIEVKGMLALLSAAVDEPGGLAAFGATDDEATALARVVPWTRLLVPGPATLPGGERTTDLVAWAAEHPHELVLKRSWDYGGKSVVLGPDHHADDTRARMAELAPGATDWPSFLRLAAAQPDLWVLQRFVLPTPRRHLLVEDGVRASWHELYVDISAYANLGDAPRPRGGACRASSSRIVNILGGGGLTPLVPGAAERLLCG
jgi:hypothetical protein